MPRIRANGIDIEYESFGPESGAETVLLIMGLGGQLTMWPAELCEDLVRRGYRVIRYDNRDVGLSTRFEHAGMPDMMAIFGALMAGRPAAAPYSLDDMARDAVGLLDALGIARAHIAGASMGGMIAQLVAADHPERVLSLTSIMSTSGNPMLPPARPEAMEVLMAPAASAGDWEAIAERGIKAWNTIGSPLYRTDERTLREKILRDARRAFYPVGIARQMAAVVANGDRREKLRRIKAPAVVLHGTDDPLVPVEGGRDTAENIPGAEFRPVSGMGHDFPVALMPVFADAIEAAARRARAG